MFTTACRPCLTDVDSEEDWEEEGEGEELGSEEEADDEAEARGRVEEEEADPDGFVVEDGYLSGHARTACTLPARNCPHARMHVCTHARTYARLVERSGRMGERERASMLAARACTHARPCLRAPSLFTPDCSHPTNHTRLHNHLPARPLPPQRMRNPRTTLHTLSKLCSHPVHTPPHPLPPTPAEDEKVEDADTDGAARPAAPAPQTCRRPAKLVSSLVFDFWRGEKSPPQQLADYAVRYAPHHCFATILL